MTTERSQGTFLDAHLGPLSPTASSGTPPGVLTPSSVSSSNHPGDPAPRRPQSSPSQAQGTRVDFHDRDDETRPSAALLAHDSRLASSTHGRTDERREEGGSEDDAFDGDEGEEADMAPERPPMHRPTGGRSEVPLLKDERGRPSYESPAGSARPAFAARRSTFRSRSPDFDAKTATRRKYIYAGVFLFISLVSFVVQTLTAQYIQKTLGWNKAYCML